MSVAARFPVETVKTAIERGLLRLNCLVSDDGTWLCHRHGISNPGDRRIEQNTFVGALGSLSLQSLDHPVASDIRKRSRLRILRTKEPLGLWRYWRELPPDADSTSICNIALGPHPALLGGWYEERLLRHRNEQGLFQTWLRDGEQNDADAVVNANVLACLGDTKGTRPAQRWLNRIVQESTECAEIHYYWDSIDLFSAMARARQYCSALFTEAVPRIVRRLQKLHNCDGSYGDGLRTAMAVTALRRLGTPLTPEESELTARYLLDLQDEDGGWPESPLSSGPEWPKPRAFVFTSLAFEIACCVEAMTVLADTGSHCGGHFAKSPAPA